MVNKLISVENINEVADVKVLVETSGKESGTEFFTPEAKLAFAKSR